MLAVQAAPAGKTQGEHLLLQWKTSASELHHILFARLRVSLYTCDIMVSADSMSGRQAGRMRGKRYYSGYNLTESALEATQASLV